MFSGGDGADRSSKSRDDLGSQAATGDARDKDKERRRKSISSPSILSADLKILGDVETAGDLHIDGVILGDVHSRRVTVGKDGEVKGVVHGEEVNIRGQVTGEIEAHSVTLAKTARVEATIVHELLTVEQGAEFLGRTLHRAAAAETAKALPAEPEEPEEAAAPEPEEAEEEQPKAEPAAAAQAKPEGPGESPDDAESAKPTFEPLPAVLAAGPADMDGVLAGKPPKQGAKDKDREAGERAEGDETADSDSSRTGIRFRPLGATQATP